MVITAERRGQISEALQRSKVSRPNVSKFLDLVEHLLKQGDNLGQTLDQMLLQLKPAEQKPVQAGKDQKPK